MKKMFEVIFALGTLIVSSAVAESPIQCRDKLNETLLPCANGCERTCDQPDIACTTQCDPGQSCVCNRGLVRNQVGECVKLIDCSCPANEHRSSCGNTCEPTCDNLQPTCTEQCDPGNPCTCDNGFVRLFGDCVPSSECKTCGANERLQVCANVCDPTCDNLSPACTEECQIGYGCACKDGFVRNKNRQCIPASKCSAPKCPKHEHLSFCLNTCEPTCENLTPFCTKECQKGRKCTCDPGYARKNGVCVPKDECKKCGRYEVYKECGSACPGSCRNPFNYGEACIDNCVEGCFCIAGYTRNSEGDCVKIEKCCDSDCGKNEEFLICGSPCGSGCPGTPPVLCKAQCHPGCFCKPGYYKNANGECCKNPKCY